MAQYLDNLHYDEVTIANGATTSDAVDIQGRGVVGIVIPAAFTGTSISFSMSPKSITGTYQSCYNSSNTLASVTVTQGRTYLVAPTDLIAPRFLKVISNSAEGAARTIGIISRVLA